MSINFVPTGVELVFLDSEGSAFTTGFFLEPLGLLSANADNIITKADATTNAIAALSDCVLLSRKIIFAGRDNAGIGSGEVESKGIFTFAPQQGTPFVTMVPGFKDALLDANKRTISVLPGDPQTKPEVQAFLNAILNGPSGPNNGATNAAGISLDAAIDGHKEHMGSLKERRGRSG